MGQLYSITPFTQLDYPGELACIAWFSGCNLRCIYCHNPDIVLKRGQKDDAELLSFLESRRGRLTGVVFSGGEATFCPSLPDLARQAKEMGYKTKLDTNGTNPTMLRKLLEDGLIDSIALDYKCPPHLASRVIGDAQYVLPFQESLTYVIGERRAGKINLEIRTTCHADFLDTSDLQWIIDDLDSLEYSGVYWLQNIVTRGDKTLGNISPSHRTFDFKLLTHPKHFSLGFRNFPAQASARHSM
jgi:pyruvate formate lyase activating enzyme